VVGVVSTGEPWQTVYAMSRTAPEETLALLARVQEDVSGGTWVTGPVGMYESVSALRACRDVGRHRRMILDDLISVPGSTAAIPLTADDSAAANDLYASDAGGAFFLPTMLGANPFYGVWDGSRLVAAAGTHVASRRYGVAAVGAVITRPSHRGRGLATVATAALCESLVEEFATIGLNVEESNVAARRVYGRLGFRSAFEYEEIELL
jgi:GNAT superfamily N-acetyltransferase